MKKYALYPLLLMYTALFLYAQDFKDTYWDMDVQTLVQTTFARSIYNPKKKSIVGDEYVESGYMMGEAVKISYFLTHNKLKAAGYDISYSPEKLASLQQKLTKKYGQYTTLLRFNFYKDGKEQKEAFKENLQKQNITTVYMGYEDAVIYKMGGDTVTGHIFNHADNADKTAPIAFLHYQTPLTDIYVYADVFLPDRIIVLYMKHEDDF